MSIWRRERESPSPIRRGVGSAYPRPISHMRAMRSLGGIAYIVCMNPGRRYQAPSVQWSASRKPFKPVQSFTAL